MLSIVVDKIRTSFEDLIRDKRALIKVLSIALILMLALVFKAYNSGQNDIEVEAASENSEKETSREVCVDIGGAVQRPGVYRVAEGTRLYEVIELAGGLRSDADTDSVNQASFVEDGIKIIIPIYSEIISEETPADDPADISSSGEISFSGIADPSLVNINIADKEQLKTLAGIGDAKADRIIEYRSKNTFKNKEDIMLVKGIGSAIYEKIKDKIVV